MKWLQGLLKDPKEAESSTPGKLDSAGSNSLGAENPPNPTETVCPDPGAAGTAPLAPPAASDVATPEPTSSAELTLLLSRLDFLSGRQNELFQAFDSRLRSDDVQGKTLERLHDELQQYKSNFVRQAMAPLLKEIIFCHDFVAQQHDRLKESESAESTGTALDAIRQMLVDALFKFDVEPFRCEEAPDDSTADGAVAFDPRTQQCLKTIPTDQPDLDKRIAARGACGFRSGETILRRELVSVYKYTASAKPAAADSAAASSESQPAT